MAFKFSHALAGLTVVGALATGGAVAAYAATTTTTTPASSTSSSSSSTTAPGSSTSSPATTAPSTGSTPSTAAPSSGSSGSSGWLVELEPVPEHGLGTGTFRLGLPLRPRSHQRPDLGTKRLR